MNDFYDKPGKEYWKKWHQTADEIRRKREATGEISGKGKIIKAGTYHYQEKKQDSQEGKSYEEKVNEALNDSEDELEEARQRAIELAKQQSQQTAADVVKRQNLEKEAELKEARQRAIELAKQQSQQTAADVVKKQNLKEDPER